MTPGILILNGSSLKDADFYPMVQTLETIFDAPVSLGRAALDLNSAYDSSRNQTNSTVLLAQILSRADSNSGKRIAVVDQDLFIPVLTFVFGEAQLSGSAAIVSTHRLSNQFYGLPRDDGLLLKRLEKEFVHELGHTFGLLHCHQFECVMRSSTYVEEIDLKRVHLCASCDAALRDRGQFSIYAKLAERYSW